MRLAAVLLAVAAGSVGATPAPQPKATIDSTSHAAAPRLTHTDVRARVAVATTPGHTGELRPARDTLAKQDAPLSAEEATAQQIEKLLRGPLRYGVTGLYVVDARTGEPVFAVNADDRLNPASNVKMISTAAALEALGPEFRYPTRLLGTLPGQDGAIRTDAYLLGSYDPTLANADLDDLATGLAARGVVAFHGDLIVGSDATRDGIFRPSVPIEIAAGTPGLSPKAAPPDGFDLVRVEVTAKTLAYPAAPRLTYKTSASVDVHGRAVTVLAIGGTIGKGGLVTYKLPLADRDRAATAAYALRASLRAHGIAVTGSVKVEELGDFVGESLGVGELPVELARHESRPLVSIVTDVNKWSINWLAERVILSAAAITHHAPPTMELAVDTMYGWLERHARLGKSDLVVDSGSGLSYRTQISARELVAVVLAASGFAHDGLAVSPAVSSAWLGSLSIGGHDGTLMNRFKTPETRGRVRGKTGTLSTVIALSGLVEIDPARPLAFALVTNTNTPLSKGQVRKTHEALVTALCTYAQRTATLVAPPVAAPVAPTPNPTPDETEPEN